MYKYIYMFFQKEKKKKKEIFFFCLKKSVSFTYYLYIFCINICLREKIILSIKCVRKLKNST
jgi:hypothetical protein